MYGSSNLSNVSKSSNLLSEPGVLPSLCSLNKSSLGGPLVHNSAMKSVSENTEPIPDPNEEAKGSHDVCINTIILLYIYNIIIIYRNFYKTLMY